MRINIADIKLEAGKHKTVPVETRLESVEFGGLEVRFEEPFTGEAEIWNAGDRLLVKVDLSGEASLVCGRCLGEFTEPLDVFFEEEFIEAGHGEGRAEEDEEEESGRTVSFYTGDEIDLTDPLRENILLELPIKPLCDADCKGLCPTCGTNLNEGDCACEGDREAVDPRLAALKDLLRKPDSNS
ncbi:MAG: YceD family protein [Bacillota bacterium]